MSGIFNYCWECKRNTVMVLDRAAGDTICSECGLVLEDHTIDERPEWRTFADDDSGDHDPSRCGDPGNWLLPDSALPTVVSHGDPALDRLQNRGGGPDRAVMLAIKAISNIADRLSLVKTIKDRASEIYKRLEDEKSTRGGRKVEALAAACIYIACRQEGKPRTVNEICSVVNGGATKKEIGRAKEFIVKQLGVEMGETIQAGDYLRRFCSNLGMSNEEVKSVQEAVHKAADFDIRRSPISIAAAIIFMMTQLSDSNKPLQDIAVATKVAQGTIKNAYKDLYPYAAKIIPQRMMCKFEQGTLPPLAKA